MRHILFGSAIFITGFLASATVSAQTAARVAYDRAAEATVTGTVEQVLSAPAPDGVIGVHLIVKTDRGLVKVHVAPALFIGQNNFWFEFEDQVAIIGARVRGADQATLWARAISKGSKMLRVRNEDGVPLWKIDGDADADGCGVRHAPMH
jgi:hypothetical protein